MLVSARSPRIERLLRGLIAVSAVVLLCLVETIALARFQGPPAGDGYQVIVHPSNPIEAVDRRFLSQAFLKKVRTWPNGANIDPVDLPPASSVRQQFSVEIIGRSVASIWNYWQQMVFSGRGLPPPQLDSDDHVIAWILRKPGGIGYVSPGANLQGARVIKMTR